MAQQIHPAHAQPGGAAPVAPADRDVRIYEDEGELLVGSGLTMDRVSLLPADPPSLKPERERMRILWGHHMLQDILEGRYRTVICGVNEDDNSHGIIAQIVDLTGASQWSAKAVTSYAKMFHEAVSVHAAHDREPYVLKYDLDSVLVFALLRPRGRTHFTLPDLARGFETIAKMLHGRRERLPVGTVSFLGARSNRLIDAATGKEPSFEAVLKTMFEAGYRGDVYPATQLWRHGEVGVFPSYPFPRGLQRMREGGF